MEELKANIVWFLCEYEHIIILYIFQSLIKA